jgi:hypothetical protein
MGRSNRRTFGEEVDCGKEKYASDFVNERLLKDEKNKALF